MDKREELQALTHIDDQLIFLERVIQKTAFPSSQQQEMKEQINSLRERSSDTNLYLAVIGEMSSGKSTFINALLRDDLLVAHAKVMTTAAATVLKPGNALSIELRFQTNGGQGLQRVSRLMQSFRNLLRSTFSNGASSNGATVSRGDREALEFLSETMRKKPHRRIAAAVADEPITIDWLPKVRNLSLRDFIRLVTTEDEIAQYVLGTTIEHHAKFLRDGVFVIDTPGLDATNPDHADVTHQVMREADAAVIIIPADKPISEVLLSHLKDPQLLAPYLHRCLYIVTRIDMIREKEREDLLKTIAGRLQRGLGLAEPPRLLACSAQSIMDDFISDDDDKLVKATERAQWQTRFVELEAQFFSRLQRERGITVAESTLRLLEQTLNQFKIELSMLWNDYNQRLNQLNSIRIRDVKSFAQEQHALCSTAMSPIRRDALTNTEILVGKSREALLSSVRSVIFGAANKQALRQVLQEQANTVIEANQREFQAEFQKLLKEMERRTEGVHQSFDSRFAQEYEKLRVIKRNAGSNTQNIGTVKVNASAVLADARRESQQQAGTEAMLGGGGLVGGALIGQMLIPIPGVGAVVGAVVGSIVTGLLGPSLSQLQNQAWDKIRIDINNSFNGVQTRVMEVCTNVGQQLENDVHSRIDQHVQQYDSVVQAMMRDYENERFSLDSKQKLLQQDMDELTRRHQQVQDQRLRLVNLIV